jgi:hypothetical protein
MQVAQIDNFTTKFLLLINYARWLRFYFCALLLKLNGFDIIRCLDPGYVNTACCESKISFIDGEKGILRYRGYDIEELVEKSTFLEVAYLLIYGELPDQVRIPCLWRGRQPFC